LNKSIDSIIANIASKEEENKQLSDNILQLAADVNIRESIRESRNTARGKLSDIGAMSSRRMKTIVARKRLVDACKSRASEIDFLRQELDIARQKTFPSFIRAAKSRVHVNPDEK
jgi:hypothetical protein